MRHRLDGKLIAGLLAPAVLFSATAQGMLLMRCGEAVRVSCCCPKGEAHASATMAAASTASCCDTLSVPRAPAKPTPDRVATNAAPPALLLAAVLRPLPVVADVRGVLHVPRLDPPQGPSLVLANCALLI
jgi:hypothetical protein